MKKFNYEEAKAGAPIQLRNGYKVVIFDWDLDGAIAGYSIDERGRKMLDSWNLDGRYLSWKENNHYDLVMTGETREVWVNMYYHKRTQSVQTGKAYETEGEATTAEYTIPTNAEMWKYLGAHKITVEI